MVVMGDRRWIVRAGVYGVIVDQLAGLGDELEFHAARAGGDEHGAKIGVEADDRALGSAVEGAAAGACAVHEIGDAVFGADDPLVIVVVAGEDGVCAPGGEGPLEIAVVAVLAG
jgi:hypothetical protein